jgi:uncharacterized protein with ATP-grasp and redox domains
MTQLPPTIRTSEPGSFARRTFETRIPRIVEGVIATNDYPSEIVAALRALREEIGGGVIRPLEEQARDRAFWDEHAREHIGKAWLDVPWYWAEAFFYRRVLEAVRYFQAGAFYRRDPYAPQKRAELAPDRAPRALAAVSEHLPNDNADAFRALMHASLWGNRADLSMSDIAENPPDAAAVERERANILVDDTARVWKYLTRRVGQVCKLVLHFICDNAGTELFFDLALADFLWRADIVKEIVFHLKPQPFFVSDAMIKDVRESLDALGQSASTTLRALARRLATALNDGRFVLSEHPFWVTGSFFHALPDDLRATFAQASLVISKGDANYRRLIGDCHWDPTASFESAVEYFPAPVVALRTLKAELVVGLKPGEAERLRAQDSEWMVNGKRGVVQFKDRRMKDEG